jgi:hypothetical protein
MRKLFASNTGNVDRIIRVIVGVLLVGPALNRVIPPGFLCGRCRIRGCEKNAGFNSKSEQKAWIYSH